MPQIRAVAFDLDGLMFNTEQLYERVMRELLRRRSKPFEHELTAQMMGRPGHVAFQIMIDWHALPDSVEGLYSESDEIFFHLVEEHLAPMPGLERLLTALEQAAVPKAIATSSRLRSVEKMLTRYGWRPRFEFVLTSEDVTHGKPHPEVYLSAAEKHGVAPGELLVLEDSQNGCRAAIAAGAFAVAVPGEHSRRHDFTGAAFVAESLADPRIYAALGLSPEESA